MAKEKKKPINNKNLQPPKQNNQNILSFSAPLAPATQPLVGQKRKIADLSHFIKREESVSPPTVQKKYFIQQFLKQKSISIQILALQCPNLEAAILKIYHATGIEKSLIYSTVLSYFQGSKHQLWSDKYTPRNLKQCLHKNFGQKILQWIRIYMNYRNCYPEESNSLFDYFGDGTSNSEYKCLRENGWKLRGLILKGRSSVGKSTLIHATAKQMECEIFNCGNECNQIKYLRERNEATQSESVKTKINKNQAQIHKTNKTLTSFATKMDESQIQPQSKRIQFMHNVNNFYPREDETKFFNELNKTIESSKIPFLMTLTGENVPQSLKIYDIMQFEEAKTEHIAKLLFLIYHIERNFSLCLNLDKIIDKEKFKQQLNEQFKQFQFTIHTTFEDFVKLTEISNKKLDFLFTFIQNTFRLSKKVNLAEAEHLMKEYLKRVNSDNLMNDYFNQAPSQTLAKEEVESCQELIDQKYFLFPENYQKIQNKAEILELTSSNSKKRSETTFNNISECDIAKIHITHENTLAEIIHELETKVLYDYKPEVRNDECFIFSKLYDEKGQQLEENLIHNISMYFFFISEETTIIKFEKRLRRTQKDNFMHKMNQLHLQSRKNQTLQDFQSIVVRESAAKKQIKNNSTQKST